MICANGEQRTPSGETGTYFFCNLDDNKGNVCRFVKWCSQLNKYEASTNKNGGTCPHFYPNIVDEIK